MRYALIAVLLCGCALDWQAMDCPVDSGPVSVAWIRTPEANAVCRRMGMPEGTLACAVTERADGLVVRGTSYSTPDVENRFLGEEFKHTFGCTHKG